MTEKKKDSNTFLIFLFLIIFLAVFYVQFETLRRRQVYLNRTIENLRERLERLEHPLSNEVSRGSHFVDPDAETYFDTPTNTFPRLIANGVFPQKGSEIHQFETNGRQGEDLDDVAVLIEYTNWNDTNRWMNFVMAQRKSDRDLKVHLFTQTNISGVSFKHLKSWCEQIPAVSCLKQTTWEAALKRVHVGKKYVISVKDHEHGADDFADFYFIGKKAMSLDTNIKSVCGGSNGIWQDKELGDVLWLSQSECKYGEMKTSRTTSSNISLRPEVARVGKSERSVNRENTWNIDHFDPKMMKTNEFDKRFGADLARAVAKKKNEFNLLRTNAFDCPNTIYMFYYESDGELLEYFENVDDLHRYDDIIPLSIGDCRVYIVSSKRRYYHL